MTILPLGEARNHLSEVIDGIERTHERVTITRHGHAVAVVVSPDDLAGMEETLAILAVPGALEAVQRGLRDIEAGRVEDWESLRAEFVERPKR
ncbi:MAG: type II toxin-antitoxin system Phd/YefM family antitoxin [Propionibacteriaceae bacterium]|nr:type II toxin-antitoxin system Phd/YefM family antitoxin [Propionibacteriaceae bacterium]